MEINKIIKAKQENSENINKFLTLFIVMITICISLILRLRYGVPPYNEFLNYFSNYDFYIIFKTFFVSAVMIDFAFAFGSFEGAIVFFVFLMINVSKYLKRSKIIKQYQKENK